MHYSADLNYSILVGHQQDGYIRRTAVYNNFSFQIHLIVYNSLGNGVKTNI